MQVGVRTYSGLSARLCALVAAATLPVLAQVPDTKSSLRQVEQFSDSVQTLASRVSPSVVRILVTRYGAPQESGRSEARVGRQESIGSGVIVDPDGYIMTNAHVVDGAIRIKVNLMLKGQDTIAEVVSGSYSPPQDASVVGVFKEGDLALIKVAATGLPALHLANYSKLRQGQVVFALGSPAGLQNSVSMGIVSSIARQPDPDSPFLYIQTDTAINPGNSGGPLINTAGEVVGLNTFILSQSGGNEGVGFAIPSLLIEWVFPQLRKYGHVHRSTIGIGVQAVTPLLAAALKLSRNSGVVITDVLPGSPAESAGIKLNDVLLTIDGRPVDSVPAMMGAFFAYGNGEHMKLQVLRASETLAIDVVPIEQPHQADHLVDFIDPAKNLVPTLGIVGVTINKQIEPIVGQLRFPMGVIVAARMQTPSGIDTGIQAGDVLHTVNKNFISSVEALKQSVSDLKPGDPVAILIERGGQLLYVSFEMQ
jgi:serine protease Do